MHPDDITWKRTASARFDSIAEQWKERGLPEEDRLSPILEMLDRPTGSLILDAGCGSGNWSLALAQRGFRVRGFDLSPEMVARAIEQARELDLSEETASFARGDIEHIEAEDSTFDGAICLRVLDFTPHPGSALLELWRVLKPGGRLVLATLGAHSPVKLKWWTRFLPDSDEIHYGNDILPWELESLLGELGWKIADRRPTFFTTLEGDANSYTAETAAGLTDSVLLQSICSSWELVAVKPLIPKEANLAV